MGNYFVKLTARAAGDLDETYHHIADDFKEIGTAKHMSDLLETAILGLDEMPYRGAIRKKGAFANRGYRQLMVKNFTIIYRIDEAVKTVVVVTVRYTPSSF